VRAGYGERVDLLSVDDVAVLRRRRSAKWSTYPDDVLPLPVAEMDFALAPAIQDCLRAALDASDTGYAYAEPVLGPAVAAFARTRWDWPIDPDAVIPMPDVGVGAVELIRAACAPGDAVVISPPIYPPFYLWIEETRTRLVQAPLRHRADGAWRLDLDRLEAAFAERPAVYVLCNPHNPVGRVHDRDELTVVARLAAEYGVTVIADEIHAPLVLPGAEFTPFLTVPGGADVGISLVSASKAFNLAGLKCAAVVTASPAMAGVVSRFPPDARWRTGHLGVIATVAAFRDGGSWLDDLLATLDARRTQLGDLIGDRLPMIDWHPPQATYLAWLDCTKLGADNEPRDLFLERGRIAVEAGLRFGAAGAGFVRLNLGTSAEVLDRATAGMAAALAG
jgi:cysteine-S-conjugate beta-lyase